MRHFSPEVIVAAPLLLPLSPKERVENGIRFLDSKLPGWPIKINVALIDIGDAMRCMLGQLFEVTAYGGGCKRYGIDTDDAKYYGFMPQDANCTKDCRALNEAWKRRVLELQNSRRI